MARPPQDSIDTFKAITGAPDDVALVKLEEHRGDLNAAINAYFSEADRVNMQDPSLSNARHDFMDIDDVDVGLETSFPSFPASRNMNHFSLLDPSFHPRGSRARSYRNSGAPFRAREIPIEFKDGSSHSDPSIPTIQDVSGSVTEHGPTIQGTVINDDDEDGDSLAIGFPPTRNVGNTGEFRFTPAPIAPLITNPIDVDNDIEEQMIMAAIEASKQEALPPPENKFKPAEVVSSSLQSADERVIYDKAVRFGQNEPSSSAGTNLAGTDKIWKANGRQGPGHLTDEISSRSKSEEDDVEDSEEQPLMWHRSSGIHGPAIGDGQSANRPSSSPGLHNNNHPQLNGDVLSDEWGGISSEERDEAVMLEAAMFGGVPESSAYPFAYPSQSLSERNASFHARIPRSPSPTLMAQRSLREQQDDEYLASLAADREKELKAIQEAEHRRSEEEAAKEAALEHERHKKEEAERKLLEEEEYERLLAVKQASLPQEPVVDDENAVTLLVRMPDGSRQGRRFLKFDKLQCLFDFIDVGKVVKSSTYRLVRPYPRQVFGEGEKELSLSELGLTNKQELLFLELI